MRGGRFITDPGALRLAFGDAGLPSLAQISTASSLPGRNSVRGPANAERCMPLRQSAHSRTPCSARLRSCIRATPGRLCSIEIRARTTVQPDAPRQGRRSVGDRAEHGSASTSPDSTKPGRPDPGCSIMLPEPKSIFRIRYIMELKRSEEKPFQRNSLHPAPDARLATRTRLCASPFISALIPVLSIRCRRCVTGAAVSCRNGGSRACAPAPRPHPRVRSCDRSADAACRRRSPARGRV
jgi:hypothetical protein